MNVIINDHSIFTTGNIVYSFVCFIKSLRIIFTRWDQEIVNILNLFITNSTYEIKFLCFSKNFLENGSKQSNAALIHCLHLIVKHPLDSCFVAFQTTPENMIRNKEWRNDPNVCNFSRIFHGNLLVINNILCCASPCKVLRLIDLLDYLLRPT